MVKARREFIVYLAISVLLLLVDRFITFLVAGSGSLSLTLMFLPVVLGGLILVVIRAIMKNRLTDHLFYRLFTFLYHSAIAVLVNGLLVQGILDSWVAESRYLFVFWGISAVLALFSVFTLFLIIKKNKKVRRRK